MQFIEVIAKDEEHSDAVVGASCGLVGDLCTAFGNNMLPLADTELVNSLLNKGRKSKTPKVKTLATWATREIRKMKNLS
jgi:importin subunit beta-1